jgi:hypothetical protein
LGVGEVEWRNGVYEERGGEREERRERRRGDVRCERCVR